MKDITRESLNDLMSTGWFRAIGGPVTGDVVSLASWEQAETSCLSPGWQDLLLEAGNRYREKLFLANKQRFNMWNEVLAEVRAATDPLVDEKLAKITDMVRRPPESLTRVIKGDVMLLCMEAEYADVYPPRGFTLPRRTGIAEAGSRVDGGASSRKGLSSSTDGPSPRPASLLLKGVQGLGPGMVQGGGGA